MVRVPESLKRLLSYSMMSSRVHKQHTEQHHVPGDASSLGIVDLKSNLWPNLALFYIVEAMRVSSQTSLIQPFRNLLDVMSRSVNDGEHQHGISHLSVEPHRLVER